MGRVLLADVARDTGLSIATVSRALAGRGDLAPATRRRVREAADRLGYAVAPSSRRGRAARHIDLVVRGFEGRWAASMTAAVRRAAARRGLDLMLTEERDDPADDWPERIRQRGSAGVVLAVITPTAAQTALLHRAGIAIVLLEPRGDGGILPTVRATDRAGAALAAEHLAARGADRFAVVVSTPAYRFGRARESGFRARVGELHPGAAVRTIVVGADRAAARGAIREEVDAARRAGGRLGVFATTDELAGAVYLAAAHGGLGIPGDLLVAGFDDIPDARWMVPPLTTVRQPLAAMATEAVRLAVAGPDAAASDLQMPTRLIVRGSTA